MNKIIREHYPAAQLPEDLRPNDDPNARVTVIIQEEKRRTRVMTLDEIFSQKGFRRRTKQQIDADIRRQRDEWDE
ncbi:MAG TPA: hypothetical protein VK456_08430 [Xanthobacteraceae bacterium]|nr:hypothetical protein [Xanthobacteraceae bacterium]